MSKANDLLNQVIGIAEKISVKDAEKIVKNRNIDPVLKKIADQLNKKGFIAGAGEDILDVFLKSSLDKGFIEPNASVIDDKNVIFIQSGGGSDFEYTGNIDALAKWLKKLFK